MTIGEQSLTNAATAHTLPCADFTLVGVDTFLVTGAVVNKMGTLPLALACRYHVSPSTPLAAALNSVFPPRVGRPSV